LCDDAWDPHRKLGIQAGEVFVPFEIRGKNIVFESSVPTAWELDSLPQIELTASFWNPEKDMQAPKTKEEATFRTIKAITVNPNPTAYDNVSESTTVLSSISTAYEDQLFCRKVIASVNVATAHREDNGQSVSAVLTNERHAGITPENLARKWNIGLETAKKTLQVTTQRGICTALHPLQRRYRVDHLHLHRNWLNGTWYTDTLLSKVKSINGNTCAQVYTNRQYTSVHPMTARSQVGRSLTEFTDNIGIPDLLWSDGAPKMTGNNTEYVREANRLKIRQRITEQGQSNQNHASEREIGELKKRWRNRMIKKNIPRRVWDYGLVYEADLLRFIPRGNFGQTAYEEVTGQTPDISEWTDFEMWGLVWFWDQAKVDLGVDNRRLGQWLGVLHHVGSNLSYWIITNSGKVLSRTTVQHAIRDDYLNMDTKVKIDTFNTEIEAQLDDTNFLTDEAGEAAFYIEDDYDTGGVDRGTTPTDEEYNDMITEETPEYEEDVFDKYIGAKLIMDVNSYNKQRG
jgi:hypothetical protein